MNNEHSLQFCRNGISSLHGLIYCAVLLLTLAPAPLLAEPILVLRSSAGTVEAESSDIASAIVAVRNEDTTLQIRLTATLARKLAQLTMGGALGLPIEIEICGSVWDRPIVGQPIVSGSFVVKMPDLLIARELEGALNAQLTCPQVEN